MSAKPKPGVRSREALCESLRLDKQIPAEPCHLSGTQILSLSHARDMLNYSPFTFHHLYSLMISIVLKVNLLSVRFPLPDS